MPIRRRMRSTLTPWAVISSPSIDDPPGIDRLEQVDAAEQRRLALARGADEAHDLVLGTVEIDAAQDLEVAERLVQALDPQGGRLGRRQPSAPLRAIAPWRAIAGDEPVGRPGEGDRDEDEDQGARRRTA